MKENLLIDFSQFAEDHEGTEHEFQVVASEFLLDLLAQIRPFRGEVHSHDHTDCRAQSRPECNLKLAKVDFYISLFYSIFHDPTIN